MILTLTEPWTNRACLLLLVDVEFSHYLYSRGGVFGLEQSLYISYVAIITDCVLGSFCFQVLSGCPSFSLLFVDNVVCCFYFPQIYNKKYIQVKYLMMLGKLQSSMGV